MGLEAVVVVIRSQGWGSVKAKEGLFVQRQRPEPFCGVQPGLAQLLLSSFCSEEQLSVYIVHKLEAGPAALQEVALLVRGRQVALCHWRMALRHSRAEGCGLQARFISSDLHLRSCA